MLTARESIRPKEATPDAVTSEEEMPGVGVPARGLGNSNSMAHIAGPIRLAGCAGVLAIVAASLVPVEWRPTIGLAKEIEHGIAYCLVAIVLTVTGMARWPQVLMMVALAAALELGQAFVPGRLSSLSDFLGSAAGAFLGFGLCSLVPRLASQDGRSVLEDPASRAGPVRVVAFVAMAVLAAGVSIMVVPGAAGWLGAGLALAMLAIAAVDAKHFIIPDPLNAAGLALGLAHSVLSGQGDPAAAMAGTAVRAAALALAFFALRLLYARLRGRQGIGLGDVKLAAVAGAWLDWSIMPIAVEIAALSALSIYMLRRYVLRHPIQSSSRLPFGLYFAPAIWIGWVLQATLLRGW